MNQEAEGLCQVAWYYREGETVEENRELAIQLYKRAIQLDSSFSKAYYGLGRCFFDDDDMECNKQEWFPLFQKAADLGNASAQYSMGYYYEENRMYQEALKWYEQAANQDDTDSMDSMIHILAYEENTGVTNYKKAFELLNKAYELKADWAALELGYAYSMIPDESLRNQNKALKYLKEAAIKGSGFAAFLVAGIYAKGEGVAIDKAEEIVWLKYASEHGEEGATRMLAQYYANPEKNGIDICIADAEAIITKGSDISCVSCWHLMEGYEKGEYGTIDHNKANSICGKFYKVRQETGMEEEFKLDAKEQLIAIRNVRSNEYSAAFAKWSLVPDSDIERKKTIITEFEEAIDKYSDLNSLRTLACLRAGMSGIKRYDCPYIDFETGKVTNILISDAPAEYISSVSVDGILDYKKAFELLDKGVAWGDDECKSLIRKICEQKVKEVGLGV